MQDFRLPHVPASLAGLSPMDLNYKIQPVTNFINNSYAIYPKNHLFNDTATLQDSITIYSANSHSRRNTVPPAKSSQKQILFLGDSNTWGIGVNDSETYPSYFQEMNPSFRVYNLGIPGGAVTI